MDLFYIHYPAFWNKFLNHFLYVDYKYRFKNFLSVAKKRSLVSLNWFRVMARDD